jgi:cellulose synthase/poly-beta-1,6-N-acetylglucosamine synthase-like glycosyltransferase
MDLMRNLEWIFVFAAVLAVYPLAVYPLVIAAIGMLRPRPIRRREWTPSVTILIPAYNEAECIAHTVENKLLQNYPPEQLQILVVSDASDDGTDDIVRQYHERGVQLLRCELRQGKAAALNVAVRQARGEIIVFSDANAEFAADAVRRMVENFADEEIGYVTGSLRLRFGGANAAGEGNSAYLAYENWLRSAESSAGSVIGVNGGVDAIRRDLYEDVPNDQITDFVLPLRVISAKRRVIYDERVRSFEDANEEMSSEFRMRVRVALRALRGLSYMRAVTNPLRHPLAAFCIWSHKILRYETFVFLIIAFASNLVLAIDRPFYRWLLMLQILAYGAAGAGLRWQLPRALRRVTGIPSYFVASNAAFAVATLRFLRGDKLATWRPRSG